MEGAKQSYHLGNPNIAKIEIYSENILIKSITDQDKCAEFQDKSAGSESNYKNDKFYDVLSDLNQEYVFVVYKEEKTLLGDSQYEKMFELTVYESSTVMKMYTPQEASPFGLQLSEKEKNVARW
ncbi:hypothetical protein [Alkaliphilus sp. B6464]|uniref:hypothetical protein n=1 Tax=Alkaliphilus sp. B6464 TaxID=2731219 RepID=UPI001BA812F7|nr:hypothetical protein [Alkaliphilus sp. B6464]QUH19968.1 hypothetical protein HYG84_08685 [Alkaliphilus sp. B6464]